MHKARLLATSLFPFSLGLILLAHVWKARDVLVTSDRPIRSMLEISYTSATAAVSTPPVPRFCSRRFSRILEKRGSWNGTLLSVRTTETDSLSLARSFRKDVL